jgi:hypothetical protein
MLKPIIKYPTSEGTFYICLDETGRFHPVYDDEDLGSYHSLEHATEDLAMDAVPSLINRSTGKVISIMSLQIPEDPGEWLKV